MKKLNTDQGFNAFGVLVSAMGIIASMPDSNTKWGLLALVCVASTVVGIKTVGDNPEHDDVDVGGSNGTN